ncbi:MAG: hypothetical protein K6T83_12555 [Alicyclobacillus sp.]|nr:hypothetical protein [Alicyclobacillus sp.]
MAKLADSFSLRVLTQLDVADERISLVKALSQVEHAKVNLMLDNQHDLCLLRRELDAAVEEANYLRSQLDQLTTRLESLASAYELATQVWTGEMNRLQSQSEALRRQVVEEQQARSLVVQELFAIKQSIAWQIVETIRFQISKACPRNSIRFWVLQTVKKLLRRMLVQQMMQKE